MSKQNTDDTTVDPKDEAADEAEESEEEAADEEESEEEESEDESEEKDESDEEESNEDDDSKKDDLDLDAELAKERGAGEPDPTIADEAFKKRDKKRKAGEGADGDKPLTQKDLDAVEARIRKEQQHERALEIAKEMAGSDKEAELIVLKWANRTFPKNLTLREQMQEAYVITHSKKLIGERDEAMRGLKGKNGVKKNPAITHKDGLRSVNEPKLSPADAASIRASGFTWNNTSRQYEKKLPNGHLLIRDSKTKQVRLQKKK